MLKAGIKAISRALRHEGGWKLLFRKIIQILRFEGLTGVWYRIIFIGQKTYSPKIVPVYSYWEPAARQSKIDLAGAPKTAIILFCESDLDAAFRTLRSIEDQWFAPGQVLIVLDQNLHKQLVHSKICQRLVNVVFEIATPKQNRGQVLNDLLSSITVDFLCTLDAGDELTVDALWSVAEVLAEQPYELVFSDQDELSVGGEYVNPWFKPDYLPEMFLRQNYFGKLCVLKKTAVESIGGWNSDLVPEEDYDLYLRMLEAKGKISHVARVLCHVQEQLNVNAAEHKSAGQQVLSRYLGPTIKVVPLTTDQLCYEIQYPAITEPRVSVYFVDLYGTPERFAALVDSTSAGRVDYHLVTSETVSTKTVAKLRKRGVNDVARVQNLNFASSLNEIVSQSTSDHIVIVNGMIGNISDNWLREMLDLSSLPAVGIVGGVCLDRYERISCAGYVWVRDSWLGLMPLFKGAHRNASGYFGRLKIVSNYASVSGRLFMFKRSDFDAIDGFGHWRLRLDMYAADFAFRLSSSLDKRHVVTPNVKFVDRAAGTIPVYEQVSIEMGEVAELKRRYVSLLRDTDPTYNLNLSVEHFDCSPRTIHTAAASTVLPSAFSESRVYAVDFSPLRRPNVCVFAHYDDKAQISDDVIYYLSHLSEYYDVVVVSNSEGLCPETVECLRGIANRVISRGNVGYDFASWRTGIEDLGETLFELDSLLLCNDSVFGPVFSLEDLRIARRESGANVFGVTDCYDFEHHLQSYFLEFDSEAIRNQNFAAFWNELGVIQDKQELVKRYEVGLSRCMREGGLTLDSYVHSRDIGYLNVTHFAWQRLLQEYRMPFIKVDLLRDNPMQVDLSELVTVVKQETDYPVELLASRFVS